MTYERTNCWPRTCEPLLRLTQGRFAGRRLRGQASAIRIGGCDKIVTQPLRARLADMQRCTDGTYRGNAIGCQFRREHYSGLLSKRIDDGRHHACQTRPSPSARHE